MIKATLFVQVSSIHLPVHLDNVNIILVPLFVCISCFYTFVKKIFPAEHHNVYFWSQPGAICAENSIPPDRLLFLQTEPNEEINTPLSIRAKCAAILPNTGAPMSVSTSSAAFIHMGRNQSWVKSGMFVSVAVAAKVLSCLLAN